jgi:hypothetical protein
LPYPVFRLPADGSDIFTNQGIDSPPSGDSDNADFTPPPEATGDPASGNGDVENYAEEFEWLDPESLEMSYEWTDEVSRSSPEYVRWLQQSLNKILGLRLAVDGISGTQTRSAVRSLQQRARITVDGIVGPQTEGALIKFGASRPPGGSAAPPTYGGGVPSYGGGGSQPVTGGGGGTLDIVTVNGIQVARSISTKVSSMLSAAKSSGVGLTGSGFRSPERQIALRKQNCGTSHYDIYEKPADQCSPATAKPGSSNHEKGLAIDFSLNGGTTNRAANLADPRFLWLKANAARYGMYNYAAEPWHWSVDGR